MAVAVKKTFALDKITAENLPYYSLSDGRNLICENQEHSDPQQALEEITEALENIEGDAVVLKLSEKSKKEIAKGGSRSFKQYEFRISLKSERRPEAITGLTAREERLMQKVADLEKELIQVKHEQRYNELERKIDELKNSEEPSPMMKLALNGFMQAFGNKPGIAGINDAPIETDHAEKLTAEAKVKKALSMLNKIDKNLPDNLLKLAEFAQQSPEKYAEVVKMLQIL